VNLMPARAIAASLAVIEIAGGKVLVARTQLFNLIALRLGTMAPQPPHFVLNVGSMASVQPATSRAVLAVVGSA
jgi:hypothetical protein